MAAVGKHETNECLKTDHDELVLLRATVRKLRAERKTMHEMLTEMGIRDDVLGDGVRTCLIGRLAIAIDMGPVTNQLTCLPTCGQTGDGHDPRCAFWK